MTTHPDPYASDMATTAPTEFPTYLPAEQRIVRSQYAAYTGVPEVAVIVTPMRRIPPMVVPPGPTRDGGRKLPEMLNPACVGDPIYWLDPATRQRQPDEDDNEFAYRLWVELIDRGYADEHAGTRRSALVDVGLDINDPAVAARIAAYQAGGADDLLERLWLEPNTLTMDAARAAAQRLAATAAKNIAVMNDAVHEIRADEIYARVAATQRLFVEIEERLTALVDAVADDAQTSFELSQVVAAQGAAVLEQIIDAWVQAKVNCVFLWKTAWAHTFDEDDREAQLVLAESTTDARIEDWSSRLRRRYRHLVEKGGTPDSIARVAALVRSGLDETRQALPVHTRAALATLPAHLRPTPELNA